MVGDPFTLEQKGPHKTDTGCRREIQCLLDRLRKREGARHGRISRDTGGQTGARGDLSSTEESVHSLMGVSQSLFETENFFSDDLKSEMAGFDDSRVNRSHRNLVNPRTEDADEGIFLKVRSGGLRNAGPGRRGQGRNGPEPLADPGAGVFQPLGHESEEIPDSPFESVCGRKKRGERWKGLGILRQIQGKNQNDQTFPKEKGGADPGLRISGGPQTEKSSPGGGKGPGFLNVAPGTILRDDGPGNPVLPGDEAESRRKAFRKVVIVHS